MSALFFLYNCEFTTVDVTTVDVTTVDVCRV
jgi:hypothetical protein